MFDDAAGWQSYSQNDRDKPFHRHLEDLSNALEAWRTNPLARRITNLTRDHVWGNGLRPVSKIKTVERWLEKFWTHDLNRMDERLPVWIDALTLDGELFPTFHTSADGMTYIRALSADQVADLEWKPNDYEQLTRIGQRLQGVLDLHWWPTLTTAGPGESAAWHYAVNRPLGAIRGEGDLTPALPWLAYYSDWLHGRVKRNDALTNFYFDITVEGDAEAISEAKKSYRRPPAPGSAVVHGIHEKHQIIQPEISAGDAKDDGRALRTMVAVGGNVPLHWLSEPGEGNSEATSNNMNDVSYRHYAARQNFVAGIVKHICTVAYQRAAAAGAIRHFADPQITISRPDINKADNERLANAARDIAQAFSIMLTGNLDTDPRIVRLIYKFAGEDLSEAEINDVITRATKRKEPSP